MNGLYGFVADCAQVVKDTVASVEHVDVTVLERTRRAQPYRLHIVGRCRVPVPAATLVVAFGEDELGPGARQFVVDRLRSFEGLLVDAQDAAINAWEQVTGQKPPTVNPEPGIVPVIPLTGEERDYYEWLIVSMLHGVERLIDGTHPTATRAIEATAELVKEALARV